MLDDWDEEEATADVEDDWRRDVQRDAHGGGMGREAFMDGLFELADMWTETIDAGEYAEFLWSLLHRVAYWVKTDGTAQGASAAERKRYKGGYYVWRDLKDIHYCEDDIRSEVLNTGKHTAARVRAVPKTA